MCGLTGFWDTNRRGDTSSFEHIVSQMADEISFRGPDAKGIWVDRSLGLAFAHLRLAILDLSDTGKQPMFSESGRYIIIYNGEVYNAPLLRKELQDLGIVFRGTSDTEVMLAAIETWGLEISISKFIGMFAFALWDQTQRKLYLVRDRLGVKPLYYGIQDNVFFFGSQPRSFKPHPSWQNHIDRDALAEYFLYNYIPGTRSIYQNLQKVPPGYFISIDSNFNIESKCYWNLVDQYHHQQASQKCSEADYIEQLEYLLSDSIKMRMLSDVPLGAFLSGGIDSSLVVALMQKQSSIPIKTFTIGFKESNFNEAPYAKKIAEYLGCEHFEHYLTEKDALDIIPKIPEFYDEPFADSSQIPTYLVSGIARPHVTVSLSGDGGDEFFAGYTRYILGQKINTLLKFIPMPLRSGLMHTLQLLSTPRMEDLLSLITSHTHILDKMQKLAQILDSPTPQALYHNLLTQWPAQDVTAITGSSPSYFTGFQKKFSSVKNYTESMQLMDACMYLPDDILTKVDRASMAHSLEAREPLLDHRLIEFSFGIPLSMKLRDHQGKWILRQILERHVPKELFDRPKQGFGLPIDRWLRTDLKSWADDLLSIDSLKRSGLCDVSPIIKRWQEHRSGTRNWHYSLWGILMYQAWYYRYMK